MALWLAAVAVLLTAMAWQLSRAHRKCQLLCQCIADMLREPDLPSAERVAARTRRDLESRGLWRS